MTWIEPSFLWIASNFNAGLYLLTSKIQGILWSGADIILVLAVLKIADLARKQYGLGRLRPLHLLLWATAILTPLLLFARTPRQFFLLECILCGTQFLILLHVAITERRRILELILQVHRTM